MHLKEIASYWDSRAEGYSLTIHEELKSEVGTCFRNRLRTGAPTRGRLSCLDIGCGPGFFSILLAQDGHSVTAVDYSEGMLSRARENFVEMGVDVSAMRADAQKLPFPDACFDYIVSRNLVWNLECPAEAYREWLRVLKPGGRLLIIDGNHYLYYYDEDYCKAQEAANGQRDHKCYGVDPTPINEIARELPLSRKHRPSWDIETLLELGMERIEVEVSRKRFADPADDREKTVIGSFVLCAEKPPA